MKMNIRILQNRQDILEFVDYLYDIDCIVSPDAVTAQGMYMDRQETKDAWCADLILSVFRVYNIGNVHNPSLLKYVSCGMFSHPRCALRMGRDFGEILLNEECIDDIEGKELLKRIKKYFAAGYTCQRYNEKVKQNCLFGPHYQIEDKAYLLNPHPDYLCPGFIRIRCDKQYLSCGHKIIEKALQRHPELEYADMVQDRCFDFDGIHEVYAGFLLDMRNNYANTIVQAAKTAVREGILLQVTEGKRHIIVTPVIREIASMEPLDDVRLFVQQQWRGFGNFITPKTYFV